MCMKLIYSLYMLMSWSACWSHEWKLFDFIAAAASAPGGYKISPYSHMKSLVLAKYKTWVKPCETNAT
jgi:hypothetical protein